VQDPEFKPQFELGGFIVRGEPGLYIKTLSQKNQALARHLWLTPVILATWKADQEASLGKEFKRLYLQNNHSKMN
jgi:hypothetical protein